MVPGIWVEMESLPVTRNGKIDKKALPDPDATGLLLNQYVAPRNETERALTEIWQDLLKVDKIGIHDNFFELGGHSLLAIKLVHVINKKLNLNLLINHLFINPTISGLNEIIHFQNNQVEDPVAKLKYLVPLRTGSIKKPALYIICGGGGTALRFKRFSEMLDEDQPVYSFQPPIDIKDIRQFPETIEKIASLFIDEMLMDNPNGPYALSGHCIGGIIAFEMTKQLEASGKKVHMLSMFDTIIRKKVNHTPARLKNLYHISAFLKTVVAKARLKYNFEMFLLKKYTKKSIRYKLISFKTFVKKKKMKSMNKEWEYVGLELFNESSDVYVAANRKYEIAPYDGEIILFYAKERYYFTDTANNIRFKKIYLNNNTKNLWREYASSVSIHEVEGDHSDMFEKNNGYEFARVLQHYLNSNKS